jgi:hypothetical protein
MYKQNIYPKIAKMKKKKTSKFKYTATSVGGRGI